MLLGCIADDLTGATDVALMLTRAGMRTRLVMQAPALGAKLRIEDADAVVVALKSRTCPPADAIAMSLAACDALLARGARQILFKYCSTFDSTDAGNIGPVADALADRLKAPLAIVCPAFPTNKRTIYQGNLFVGDVPLAESSMKDHPLTPMRDSNLVRVMGRQTRRPVGLVPYAVVRKGADAIADALHAARARGERYVVCDALTDEHLYALGQAATEMPLLTGGSGIALGLPATFVKRGELTARPVPTSLIARTGRSAILAGSCSEATRGQIATAVDAGLPALRLDPEDLLTGRQSLASLQSWCAAQAQDKPFLVYSSATPEAVRALQSRHGRDAAGHLIEQTFGALASALVDDGVTRLIVAGGETSGAVIAALAPDVLEVGPEIDPGVPWTRAIAPGKPVDGAALALKSGNFGAADFFLKAWRRLA
jgi:uncharacterized protein YgbK (DUF1537 family)